MKGRVVIKQSSSELVMVEVQYNVYNEEHPGVTNRNHKESRLVGAKPLQLVMYISTLMR